MFTGLIESVQPVKSNTAVAGGRRLSVPLGELAHNARVGDSICVSGVCLTISELDERMGYAIFDVMAETVRTSTLERLRSGETVNLERALSVGGRLDGHFVQGHVDGVGTIDRTDLDKAGCVIRITAGPEVMLFTIKKGSIAVDGVSLTVVDVQADCFSVALIPTTLSQTNLKQKKRGDKVNLEADLICKWIRKRLDEVLPATGRDTKLTMKKLREQGLA